MAFVSEQLDDSEEIFPQNYMLMLLAAPIPQSYYGVFSVRLNYRSIVDIFNINECRLFRKIKRS